MRFLLLLLMAAEVSAQYRLALPGYRYSFPQDHFNHPEFQTEWWYYTGNLRGAGGEEFGFELTFFRQAVDRTVEPATWAVRDLYLAHLALTDITGKKFYHAERLNRAGPGLAGVDESSRRVWNGNWEVRWVDERTFSLRAIDPRFSLSFQLKSQKPPVIHGENGVSQKAEGVGRASHYVSLTRLEVSGEVRLGVTAYRVNGLAWMDHEFFTHQLNPEQVGWDWMSLQLSDGRELMVFQLRRRDGSIDPYSSGTLVERDGRSRRVTVRLTPGRRWNGYPVEWTVEAGGLKLQVKARLDEQELVSRQAQAPTYWEGAISITGDATGAGYLEMTGYRSAVRMGE